MLSFVALILLTVRYFNFRRLSTKELPNLEETSLAEMKRSSGIALAVYTAFSVLSLVQAASAQTLSPLAIGLAVIGVIIAAGFDFHAERIKRKGTPVVGPVQATRTTALIACAGPFIGYFVLALFVVGLLFAISEPYLPQLRGTWTARALALGVPLLLAFYMARRKFMRYELVSPSTHVHCPDCRALVLRSKDRCQKCGCSLVPQ